MVEEFLRRAFSKCSHHPPGLLEKIKETDNAVQFSFPFKKNGDIIIVKGYRAQHSRHRLPCKVRRVASRFGRACARELSCACRAAFASRPR
jgi:glutamate dehydrogenase/leucine dehydrogenase